MANTQMGKCALCRQDKELQLSHIVPHFVGRKLIKTSAGNIRNTNKPNQVAQDIERHYMLCHDCEEIFSRRETWFANHIFSSRQDNNEVVFDYDENLTFFIISLSWRSLYLDLNEYIADPNFDQDILFVLLEAEATMRDFLMGKRSNIGTIENHIFFMDRIKSADNFDSSQNPSVVMHRSISSYTTYNGKTSFTISNLMGILVVTFYSMDMNEQWSNTKIEFGLGKIQARNQHMKSVAGQEIQYWIDQAEEARQAISEVQRQKIKDKFNSLGDDIKQYPIYQDWIDDSMLLIDGQKTKTNNPI